MLEVLDEAAERGLINDLPARLTALEHQTPYYIGEKARHVIEGMLERDLQRKQSQEQDRKIQEQAGQIQEPTAERKRTRKRERDFGMEM